MTFDIRCCDNMDLKIGLPSIRSNSIDAVVSDPPASIGFMSLTWDTSTREAFIADLQLRMKECLRVLKPGGHALIWALPRTSHWTKFAIEDAGFEIRDVVYNLQAKGFPKSLNISKAFDKRAGVKRKVIGKNPNHRPISGAAYEGVYAGGNTGAADLTIAGSELGKKWEGWGSALKPAVEEWILARKPFKGTLIDNLSTWGVGALNVDACRVATADKLTRKLGKSTVSASGWASVKRSAVAGKDGGRWPATLVLTHEPSCVMAGAGWECDADCSVVELNRQSGKVEASRFFPQFGGFEDVLYPIVYQTKSSTKEKNVGLEGLANTHPCVKAIALCQWLVRLITPPGGTVLDPYMGSGSIGVGALKEGALFIGIEREIPFWEIAKSRLEAAVRLSE